MRVLLLLAGLIGGMSHPVWGQLSISTSVPGVGGLTICEDSATFSTQMEATAASLTGLSITINMPPGMTYVSGSLTNTGAGSHSVYHSSFSGNSLILNGDDLTAGDTYDFSFECQADCQTLDYFLDGFSLQDTLLILYNGSSLITDSTSKFNNAISYAELSMPQPSTPSGAYDQTVQRIVTVNNSGDGCLSRFDWYDAYGGDIQVDSVYFQGVKLNTSSAGDTIFYTFSDLEFSRMGDSTQYFCRDDSSLALVEYIRIIGCSDKASDLGVSWGCGGDSCARYTTTGDVSISPVQPNLTFNFRDADMPACFHEQANRKEMIIANNGSGKATSVEIEIKKYFYAGQFSAYKYDGLDTSNVQIKYNDGSYADATVKNVEGNVYYNSCSQPYVYRFSVDIPDLDPGDSAVIAFDMINCEPTECGDGEIRQGAWGYNYRYQVPCVSGTTVISNQRATNGSELTFVVSNYDNPTITAGEEVLLTSTIENAVINYPGTGIYVLRFELPSCGMSFSGDSLDLFWQNISGDIVWPQDSFTLASDTLIAYYSASNQPSDFELTGSDVNVRVVGSCDCPGPNAIQSIQKGFRYIPEVSCSRQAEIELYCEDIDITIDLCDSTACEGIRINDFAFWRTSYGSLDTDYNRQPEAGSIDTTAIRVDRYRLGDTISTVLKGYVEGSSSFDYGYASIQVDVARYLRPLGGRVVWWDQSAGTTRSCDTLLVTSAGDTAFVMDYSPSSLSAYAAGWAALSFANADTIWLYPKFIVDSTSTNSIDVGIVNPVDLYLATTANPTLEADQYSCGSARFSSKLQIVPMVDGSYNTTVSSTSCGNTQARTFISMNTGGGSTDMFPSEYRTWSFPDTLLVVKPADFDFVEASLFLRFSPYTKSLTPVPVDATADTLLFDLRALVNSGDLVEPDDGYELQFFTDWSPNCQSAHSTDVSVPVLGNFSWENGLDLYDTEKSYNPTIRHTEPDISLSNVSAVTQDGLSNSVSWEIGLSNISSSSAANYTWLAFSNRSGMVNISDVQISSSSLTQSGGIYQIGTLSASATANVSITAGYSSCDLDSLYVYAGWDCDSFPASLSSYPCGVDTFLLMVDPKPANAQLTINSLPANPVTMCDSLTYDFAVTATQMANVEDIVIDVFHSGGGLDLLNGTSLLEYPNGSGYTAIADPSPITGGFRFTMADYDGTLASAGLEGLGGSSANNRTLNFQFQMETNCNFGSGDVFYVRMTGTRPCGDPITVLRVMDPVTINGVSAPYSTNISTSLDTVSGCENAQTVTFNIKPIGGSTRNTDSIYVTLPVGFTYVDGTFTGVQHAPSPSTPNTSDLSSLGTRHAWVMPNGVAPGDSIVFQIDIEADNTTGCSSSAYSISVRTVFASSVTCDGIVCADYFGSTGTGANFMTLEKPDLDFSLLSKGVANNGGDYIFHIYATLDNQGTDLTQDSTSVSFYCDVDSSGTISAGDNYLGDFTEPISIASGDSYTLNTSINVPAANCGPDVPIIGLIQTRPDSADLPAQCLCDTLTAFQSYDISLPVNWLEIKGKASAAGNLVEGTFWTDGPTRLFMLERRTQGGRWEPIHLQEVRKNSGLHQVRITDPLPPARAVYRLVHLGIDGEQSYSHTLSLAGVKHPIRHYPNPVQGILYVEMPEEGAYYLSDILGRRLKEGHLAAGKHTLSLADLAEGVYLLQIRAGAQTLHRKIRRE